MIIGILKEIKPAENRVAMTPAGVEVLMRHGHQVLVEKDAGSGSGFTDADYFAAGAAICVEAAKIFSVAEMVMHVKEPQPEEYGLIRKDQIVFTYLHLAAERQLTQALLDNGCIGIAYETIQKSNGTLPLLKPMSEVAGRMAVQEAAKYLEMAQGGRGILLGGVPGVEPATVVILGGGVVGINAAKMACGLGAKVYILDTNMDRLEYLSHIMPPNCFTVMSNPANIRNLIKEADAVIGAVLVAGGKAPMLLTHDMLKSMKPGAVVVDVAIDQGGCFETSKPTTHAAPVYAVEGIVHYCVTNMPGAVPKTSTLALTNATLPYALEIANKGWRIAVTESPEIRLGVNTLQGNLVHPKVAEALGRRHIDIDKLL